MHKYIFNVSAERMSNYPVIEQSTCSAVINYAILYFCKTYWELGKQQQSHKDLPSGTSQHPDISGAGVRTGQCPKGCHVWQEARPPWVASFWIRAAPFLGFIGPIFCPYELHVATGWIPKSKPVYISEKGKGKATCVFVVTPLPTWGCKIQTHGVESLRK